MFIVDPPAVAPPPPTTTTSCCVVWCIHLLFVVWVPHTSRCCLVCAHTAKHLLSGMPACVPWLKTYSPLFVAHLHVQHSSRIGPHGFLGSTLRRWVSNIWEFMGDSYMSFHNLCTEKSGPYYPIEYQNYNYIAQ